MLKLYGHYLSFNVRRVWVMLLEKQLEFEPISVNLAGEQFQAEFLKINPFHHVPVLVDEDFTVVESLAILDYLEAKFPQPAFLPTEAKALALVRMVELLVVNELQPALIPLLRNFMAVEVESQQLEQAQEKVAVALRFLEEKLAGNPPYFLGEQLSLADIVAGTALPALPMLGVSLADYPSLAAWLDRLVSRESWQQTTPSPADIEAASPGIKSILARR